MHQSITCHRLFDQDGIKTVPQPPYSPDLAPCDFWLLPKLRGCGYETIEERKEAVTKVIGTLTQEDFHWGLPELVWTVQQVHCSRWRLLRRGLEFHACTINKSAHMKKVWKLIVCPLYTYTFGEMVYFVKSDKMIGISGKMDKSNTYNKFSSVI